ncbi:MAG TPA: hypothetical protein VJG49_00620, partial [Candidatus Nanoarchaeia archaeon]|nr:hypothetical protein [Candidatus Nanoarchaeia archaeon]
MNTKAQVHDLADLFIMMIFMFFLSFFLYGIFSSNVSSADDASLEKISSYNTETLLLHYLGRPVPVDAEEILMRDLILTAVNEDDEDLFEEKTEQFFEQNELKGRVQLSNSAGENLMSFSNTPNFRLEES